jgi:hypothetical protein
MATSLINVQLQTPGSPAPALTSVNVLAADSGGKTALQIAIGAALASAPSGSVLQGAYELGGKNIDLTISTGHATDPKMVFHVQFRAGSGAGGTNVNPVSVYVNPASGTSAFDLAIQTAAQSTGGVPSTATLVGQVDIDATASADSAATAPLTKLQFRSLFTLAELVAIDNYNTSSSLSTEQKAMLQTIMKNFEAAEDISLANGVLQQGVHYLVSAGLLTAARAATILAGKPAPTE